MKPSIIIDMIAQLIAKRFLPNASPAFSRMTDMELLSIVSWAERWDGKKVYHDENDKDVKLLTHHFNMAKKSSPWA